MFCFDVENPKLSKSKFYCKILDFYEIFPLVENMLDADSGNKASGKDKTTHNDFTFKTDKLAKLENHTDTTSQEDPDADGSRVISLPCPPLKPEDSDCCGSRCVPCVFNIYEQDLKIWKQECRKIQHNLSNRDDQVMRVTIKDAEDF